MNTQSADLVYSSDDDASSGKGWYLRNYGNDRAHETSPSFRTEAAARKWASRHDWTIVFVSRGDE